jgi:hypothetical protein
MDVLLHMILLATLDNDVMLYETPRYVKILHAIYGMINIVLFTVEKTNHFKLLQLYLHTTLVGYCLYLAK